MTAPKPPRLLDIDEGIYVAGTHDIHTAVRIVAAEHRDFEDYKRDMPLADVPELAGRLHALLNTGRTEWYRIIPENHGNCLCGGCHDWDLSPATAGSRGAFKTIWWE